MKNKLSVLVLILIFLAGIALLLYPTVSNIWNTRVQSEAIVDYQTAVENLTKSDFSAIIEQANRYNQALAQLNAPLAEWERLDTDPEFNPYSQQIVVDAGGMMGYIAIDALDIRLPIYHGTDDAVLAVGAGHLQGSSLPVGGIGTHCVISAHRGLPSAKLFTDIDQMVLGDTFTLNVLDQVLTYQVDQILIVEPEDVQALAIDPEMDYCTLVTCTPYGVNTHRLLVRGHRITTQEAKKLHIVEADARRIEPITVVPFIAAPILLLLMIVVVVRFGRKGRE